MGRYAVSIAFCVGYGRRVKSLDDNIVIRNVETDKCMRVWSCVLHLVVLTSFFQILLGESGICFCC